MPSAIPEGAACEDSPLLPLASSELQPKASLLGRLFKVVWGSCTCCALAGSLCVAISNVGLKILADEGVSVFQIALFHSILGLSMFVPWGYHTTGMLMGPLNSQTKWIFLEGFLAGSGCILGCFPTVLLGVATGSFLNNSYPALVAFLVWLLGIESLDYVSCFGIFGALVSEILIANPPFISGDNDQEWDTNRIVGVSSAFLGVTFISFGYLVMGKLDQGVPSVVVTNNVLGQLAVISIPFLGIGYPAKMLWRPSLRQLFITRAFQIGPPLKTAILSLTRVILNALSGPILLSEHISLMQGLGGVCMLASISVVVWSRDREKKKQFQQLDAGSIL